MTDTPERSVTEVVEAPEQGSIPEAGAGAGVGQEQAPRPESYLERLEQHKIQVRADDFTQHVVNNQGQQITQAIPSNVVTITIPANQQQIMDWSKGPEDQAITWLSRYWIRMIKKAILYGWKLIMPPPQVQSAQPVSHSAQNV